MTGHVGDDAIGDFALGAVENLLSKAEIAIEGFLVHLFGERFGERSAAWNRLVVQLALGAQLMQ
jgi:hypothetical protein